MKPRALPVVLALVVVAGISTLGLAVARATFDPRADNVAAAVPSPESLRWAVVTAARMPVDQALEDYTSARYRAEAVADDQATVCGWLNTRSASSDYTGFRRYLSDGHRFLIEGGTFRTWPPQEAGGDALMVRAVDLIEKGRLASASEFERGSAEVLAGPTFQWYWKSRCPVAALATGTASQRIALAATRSSAHGHTTRSAAHASSKTLSAKGIKRVGKVGKVPVTGAKKLMVRRGGQRVPT
ncbi:MAG TPA: hypothetical protein VLU41_14335 [Ideonella sp.]|nr:hypothetical protein [Ideonella sp.]